MVEKPNNGKINMYPNLDNVIQFILGEINTMRNIAEICERETTSKALSTCIAEFDFLIIV